MTDSRLRVALIHATPVAIQPIEQAFAQVWPEAERMNILDDSLPVDRGSGQELPQALLPRFRSLALYAQAAGARGVLFSCSAFGPAIEDAARAVTIPVLKPNEAMFREALMRGSKLGMVATFEPAVATMHDELVEEAAALGVAALLDVVVADGALDALRRGDAETHNRLVAAAARDLGDCDAVMLAHFSTSIAEAATTAAIGPKVITAPDAAARLLRRRVLEQEGSTQC